MTSANMPVQAETIDNVLFCLAGSIA